MLLLLPHNALLDESGSRAGVRHLLLHALDELGVQIGEKLEVFQVLHSAISTCFRMRGRTTAGTGQAWPDVAGTHAAAAVA